MPEDMLGDVQQEGEVIKDSPEEKVEKTTSDSTTEKKQGGSKPSQQGEDNTVGEDEQPPKENKGWIKMRKENKELRERLEQLDNRFKEVEPLLKERKTPEKPLPDFWKKAYGDTPESRESYRNYEEATKAERDRIKQEVLEEFRQEQTQLSQQDAKAKDFIESEVEAMQEEGLKFEKNELFKFIIDFKDKYGPGSLLDETGNNYDLRKCLNMMQELQPKTQNNSTAIKKQVAGDTMVKKVSAPRSGEIPVVTTRSLRNGNWRDAEKT